LLPFSTFSSESSRKPAFGRSPLWQRTQEAWKIGLMSLAKVTPFCVDEAGSLLVLLSAAIAETPLAAIHKINRAVDFFIRLYGSEHWPHNKAKRDGIGKIFWENFCLFPSTHSRLG
jgi:hypothetical protein